jgi:hypothetical protein
MVPQKIVGLSAGVLAWAILFYGLDAIAAQIGVQEATWPYVEFVLWPIRVISVAGAVMAGWVCARWAGRRKRPARTALAAFAAVLLLLMVPIGSFWFVFGMVDSDYRLVSGAMVNLWLPDPIELPPGSHRVHAVLSGGISPVVRLRFEAPPQEAEQYVAAALRMAEEEGLRDFAVVEALRAPNRRSRVSWRPTTLASNDWWTPEDQGPWWYKGTSNKFLFVQRHSDGKTIFLVWGSD